MDRGGAGQATIEEDETGFAADDTAFKLFAGYSFNQNFAVELEYIDGGTPYETFGPAKLELEFSASAFGESESASDSDEESVLWHRRREAL